jgi:hypothetical protein
MACRGKYDGVLTAVDKIYFLFTEWEKAIHVFDSKMTDDHHNEI